MEAALNSTLGRTSLGSTLIRLGRAPDNQVVVNDSQVSSHHAEIAPDANGTGYAVTDLNSTNGTFVNEQRIPARAPHPLKPGDKIRLGGMTFTYEATEAGYDPTVVAKSPGYDPTVFAAQPAQTPSTMYVPPQEVPPLPYGNYNEAPPPPQPAYSVPQQAPYPVPPPTSYAPPPASYAAPAYAQPGGYVGGAPGAPTQNKNRMGLWIGIIVAVVVVLGGSIFAITYANRSTPEKTLQAECTAWKNNDAQGLYNTLSQRAQAQVTVDQIKQEMSLVALAGGVSSCTVGDTQENGSTATGHITIIIGQKSPSTATQKLVNENGTWKLDSGTNDQTPTS